MTTRFIPIKWQRYAMPKTTRPWTKGRLHAAQRAVQREKDKTPLFPDMSDYQTVDDRVKDIDETEKEFLARMRADHCRLWRKVRRALRAMRPSLRLGVLTYWRNASYPIDPLYLLQVIRDCETFSKNPWRQLRRLRLYKLCGQNPDPKARAAIVQTINNIGQ